MCDIGAEPTYDRAADEEEEEEGGGRPAILQIRVNGYAETGLTRSPRNREKLIVETR